MTRNLHGVQVPLAHYAKIENLACALLAATTAGECELPEVERQAALVALRVFGEWQHVLNLMRPRPAAPNVASLSPAILTNPLDISRYVGDGG